MSHIAKGALIMLLAFWFYWYRVRRHNMEVTRAMIEGHVLMVVSMIMEGIAFAMEMIRGGSGAAILMMIAGVLVFSAGRSFYTGRDGTGRDIM